MTHDSCHILSYAEIWLMTHDSLWGYERTWLMTPYEDMKGHDSCLLMRIWKDMTHDSLCRYERSPESCRTCDMERISKESWYQRWIWKESWLCVPMTHSCAHRRQTQTTQTWCHTCDVRRMRKAADTWRVMNGVMSHVMKGHESWVMWWMDVMKRVMSHISAYADRWRISSGDLSFEPIGFVYLNRVVSHMWMSRVTHVNESCHTCEWVVSRMWMSHITHVNESCHAYFLWMRHDFVVNESCLCCEWVMTVNESCRDMWMRHDFEWVPTLSFESCACIQMTDSIENATPPRNPPDPENQVPRSKFKLNQNLYLNLNREIPRNLSFSIWWILGVWHFQWKLW